MSSMVVFDPILGTPLRNPADITFETAEGGFVSTRVNCLYARHKSEWRPYHLPFLRKISMHPESLPEGRVWMSENRFREMVRVPASHFYESLFGSDWEHGYVQFAENWWKHSGYLQST